MPITNNIEFAYFHENTLTLNSFHKNNRLPCFFPPFFQILLYVYLYLYQISSTLLSSTDKKAITILNFKEHNPDLQYNYISEVMHHKYTALFTTVNLLLGVGPLILPLPFYEAGVALSSIWMVIIAILSYNSAMYIAESMEKLHHIEVNIELQKNGIGQIPNGQQTKRNSLMSQGKQMSVITGTEKEQEEEQAQSQDDDQLDKKKEYDHSMQFQILYGENWKYVPSVAIAIYLIGTCISKCIMTGNTLSRVFTDINAPKIFDDFRFWLVIFFLSGALFSFKSIQKTKVMQTIIIGVRFISILMFIIGAIYLICANGVQNLAPPGQGVFNFNHFVDIFSNSVFSFMFHHSFPSIALSLKSSEQIAFVGRMGFLISGFILLVLPLTASMAFGDSLDPGGGFVYYNFDFEYSIPAVYWVTSFYVFLNIAAFSVYIIVIRTYILKVTYPAVNPRTISKHTLISSTIILTLVLIASFFLKDQIQIVLDFTGGIFGTMILFLMPSMQVWKARRMLYNKDGEKKDYFEWMPLFIFVLGLFFMGFNLYGIIIKL